MSVRPTATGARPDEPQAMSRRLRLVQVGPVAFRIDLRMAARVAFATAALLALGAWGLTLGSFRLPLADVVRALLGSAPADAAFIVMGLRLPRVLAAMLVGPALAMSGAIFQGLLRNPLVSPDVIGINAGASVAAVWWIISHRPPVLLPVVAFAGALGAAAAVYLLTWRGHISGARLILVGIGAHALLTAGTTALIVRANVYEAATAYRWMTGSLAGSDWGDVATLAAALALLVPAGLVLMWPLRALQYGDQTARSLGLPLERTRLALMAVGCALSAVAVSVAGPVGFVAFMVPHLARMLAGPVGGGLFLFTGALGGLLLLGADLLGQHALPVSLPVGVITAALGAPYFLFLLYRTNAQM
ncbi:iron complex transport system permease protein [Symbiobacterium terraclitae]|uniref:Iron complex transport system permease protein n=1 Tax=Symbiobacterium terraclitae TaxID=557451 RepID=A0ABS4JVS2_9FIRM|nr:iron ABC transporter permease [Symbiobacterium terraclitae]MBP2018514.1 iron complex transport system permease protein [Symbiobacterium terraclitae]